MISVDSQGKTSFIFNKGTIFFFSCTTKMLFSTRIEKNRRDLGLGFRGNSVCKRQDCL